ncbi:MAG: heparinase II/III domain-containing protein, partial [Planctomycetota bacterium]
FAYPFLRDAAFWQTVAVNGLNEEFDIQFREDGSHEELSIHYGTGTWIVFVHYYVLSQLRPDLGLDMPPVKMERIAEYYLSATKPFGLSAAMGDVGTLRSEAMRDPAGKPTLETPVWDHNMMDASTILARDTDSAVARYILGKGEAPTWTSRYNGVSGYTFLRDGWEMDALWAGLNLGYYANCHCHHSLLGLEVAAYGREFVIDPANGGYAAMAVNANLARTRAHSTLSVDGLDQQTDSPVKLSRLFLGERTDLAVGVYKGGYVEGNRFGPACNRTGTYSHAFWGNHFRHLLFIKGSGSGGNEGYWVLFDALSTEAGHTAETRLAMLPNNIRPLEGGGYATGYSESNMAFLPLQWAGWEGGIVQGEEDPFEGWLPAGAGRFVPAPVYKATMPTDKSPCWHGTLLFPYREAEMPEVNVTAMETGGAGFAYRFETESWTDYVFLSNSWMPQTVTLDDIETDTVCLHLRFEDGRATRGFACEGSFLRVGESVLFDAPGTMLAREFSIGEDGKVTTDTQNPRRG